MTTTMDIAVCFDCSLLASFYKSAMIRTINSLIRHGFSCARGDIRMTSIEFQSHAKDWLTKTRPFTSSMSKFQRWINQVQTEGVTHMECKEIADVLEACLTLNWRSDKNSHRYHEKLVILFTDGPPCNLLNNDCCTGNPDLWKIADEFNRQNITLVVVGLGPSVVICDDFYCALARKTGGEYLPLINAQRVLSFVVKKAIAEERTLSGLFRRLNMREDIEANSLYNYSHSKTRVSFMHRYCRTMNDIRKWLYTFDRPSKEVEFCLSDSDEDDTDLMPGGPPQTSYLSPYDHGYHVPFTSTPSAEDEGYRTRLPTTASLNSSFYSTDESSLSSDEVDSLILLW